MGTQKKFLETFLKALREDHHHKRQRQDCLIIIDLVSWPKQKMQFEASHHRFWEWFPFLKWLMDRISLDYDCRLITFFLQNLIWREATIVWNGHQSKKLKNRFRLRCSKGPIVYWILWGRIKWNWLNEKSLLEFVPSFLQFRILQWGWKDKQMQISLVFC